MDGKSRVFRPEAEKVWHEDYQCEYYRGVIIDGEDNIVERCAKMHPNYTAAFSDAVEKMSVSPLYSRQTSCYYYLSFTGNFATSLILF